MGDPNFSERRLSESIEWAGLEFVDSLNNKLEEPLGKIFGGTYLSVGQWQKVAIARAFYKIAALLILDEPSASLDPISESKLFDHFVSICHNKSAIFVTHRLTSVKMADRILLLNQGRVVALGSHEQLMNSEPMYNKMFSVQASRYFD